MIIYVIITLFYIYHATALIGYDCGSRQLNVTTLSLQDVGNCDLPEASVNVSNQYIQLLQLVQYSETTVYQCKVIIHRTVYYCGMHSHTSLVANGENEYIFELGKRSCLQLHRSGFIQISGTHTIMGIRVNSSSTHSVTFAGYIDNYGACKGVGYSDPFGSWSDVVVQGTVKVKLSEHTARVQLGNNKIHLKSGTSCTLSVGSCIDEDNGYTYWDPIPTDSCKFYQYGIIYSGIAHKMIDFSEQNTEIIYSLATKDITFALTAKGKEMVCGYTITKTEHPKLLIFETERGNSFALENTVALSNMDIFTYMNSKFVYVEKHIRAQMKSLYRDVLLQRCNLERQTIKTSLSMATLAPDEFAFDLMKGPGYMAVVAGEVVHVVKCVPVEVKVEHGEHCYAELQVIRNNQTFFLTPRTHILKSQGTKMPCNNLLPAFYYVNGAWYKMMPTPTEARVPNIIKPMKEPTWEYVNPSALATSGIYTEADLEQLRERIMFPVEKPAILNDLAREMRGHPIEDNEGTIVRLLNEHAVEQIINSTWGTIWNKFMTFGTISAGIIAILMTIHVIKLIIDIAVQGYALHSIYGWSIHLLAALWSSITHLLIHLGTPSEPTTTNYELQESAAPMLKKDIEIQTENEAKKESLNLIENEAKKESLNLIENEAKKKSLNSTENKPSTATNKNFFSLDG